MPFQNSKERNSWLPRYLGVYNGHRDIWLSMASALSPQQSLQRLPNAE